jgi:hypothetical protein
MKPAAEEACDHGLVDELTRAAHEAMLARDWEGLRLILHPYLHWTAADGSWLRGRTKVIERLQNAEPLVEPGRCGAPRRPDLSLPGAAERAQALASVFR